VSDVLNFVLKDDASNTWYDHFGSNFAVALSKSSGEQQTAAWPDLPKQLVDTWAWIRCEGECGARLVVCKVGAGGAVFSPLLPCMLVPYCRADWQGGSEGSEQGLWLAHETQGMDVQFSGIWLVLFSRLGACMRSGVMYLIIRGHIALEVAPMACSAGLC
jgi:hypothetical protein